MSKVRKFNVAVHMPERILAQLPKRTVNLKWTDHALDEAVKDDFWDSPDGEVNMRELTVVEVETDNDVPFKFVARWPYDGSRDMVLAAVKKVGYWSVVTCWSNHKDDNHATLRKRGLVSA